MFSLTDATRKFLKLDQIKNLNQQSETGRRIILFSLGELKTTIKEHIQRLGDAAPVPWAQGNLTLSVRPIFIIEQVTKLGVCL